MHELAQLKKSTLVEVRLWEVFPTLSWHELIPRQDVLDEVIDRLGFLQVTEDDITEYASLTRQKHAHWRFGEGRRFLMAPLIKEERGQVISYAGPYDDCGTHGFELGLWRIRAPDPTKTPTERFPEMSRHPVQIAYRACSVLVAKAAS